MSTPQGWQSILDEGESILWQGRPNGRITFKASYIVSFIFGLFFAGFALFWMTMASRAGGGFWMFGLIHFSVGLGIAFLPPFWAAFSRRHTWYTLTDRRAFIATDKPFIGRKLKSYPIDEDTPIEFTPGDFATIEFAHEVRRTKNNGTRRISIGFERIAEGDAVYRLIRDIQRGKE